jgi:hypothetical protein
VTYLAIALALAVAGLALALGRLTRQKKDAERTAAGLEHSLAAARSELEEAGRVIEREHAARRGLEARCANIERTVADVAKNVPGAARDILNSLLTPKP